MRSITKNQVEEEARKLARANAESEMSISKVYSFSTDDEIRLVAIDSNAMPIGEDESAAIYFAPDSEYHYPSGFALMTPEDEKRAKLPEEWRCDWKDGRIVYDRALGESE